MQAEIEGQVNSGCLGVKAAGLTGQSRWQAEVQANGKDSRGETGKEPGVQGNRVSGRQVEKLWGYGESGVRHRFRVTWSLGS